MPVEIAVPRGQWLRAQLAEDGTDWVLTAAADAWRLETDTAPSRLATEHLTLPGSAFPILTIAARTWSGDQRQQPQLRFSCAPWHSSLQGSLELMWGGAWLVEFERAREPDAAVRLDQSARAALERALHVSTDARIQAAAQHTIAYLLHRAGHRVAAAETFDAAADRWQIANRRGAQLAARFHAAQARLNGGAVADATKALEVLAQLEELEHWPFLAGWVANDLCMARRELGDWDRAADCFSGLADRFEAKGLLRESALARCNRLSALAGGRRWQEAMAATDACVESQFATGGANGRAQALHLRGWVRLQQGELRAGIDDLVEALRLLETSGDKPMSWQVRSLLAGAWLVLDEGPRAVAMLRAGLAEFPAQRDPGTHARLVHEIGRIERWAQAPQAAATLADARDRYQALGWTRLHRDVACELASAGWAQPADDCAPGRARVDLAAGHAQQVLQRALDVDTGDWTTDLFWLELAIDAVYAGAEPDGAEILIHRLVGRSRSLDDRTELSRRIRAAVYLELAGAMSALVAVGGRRELADQAFALLRSAGPPLSSARSVLFGAGSISPATPAATNDTAQRLDRAARLPSAVAEIGYLRFGTRSFWLIARSDQVHVRPAPTEARVRMLEGEWRQVIEQGADAARIRSVGAVVAAELGLAALLAADDRIWLTHFNGAIADLPWSALPRTNAVPVARLGYSPLGTSLAIVATAGTVDAQASQRRILIDQLLAVSAADLPVELAGSRQESNDLAQLATTHRLPLKLLSLAELSTPDPHFAPASLLLLSGHAVADREVGESAALKLGADGGRQWGTLDLESWRHPPRVLILGACESATGPQRRYFGDFGLASAAARSGTDWVLGHRWPVDDQAAATLHRSFIAALLDGAGAGDSLIAAQTALAESRRFWHPRHWAGATLLHSRFAQPVREVVP